MKRGETEMGGGGSGVTRGGKQTLGGDLGKMLQFWEGSGVPTVGNKTRTAAKGKQA